MRFLLESKNEVYEIIRITTITIIEDECLHYSFPIRLITS